MQDAGWTRIIANEYEINGSPDLPWAAGTVAYRQCYRNCSALKWAAFRKEFDALMMKQWQQAPEKGGDSRGMMDRWKVFWREDEGLEDLSMDELRERFTTRTDTQGENPSNQFFVVVNDEVVDSTLEGPAKGKIPFVYAIDPNYEVEKEGEEEEDDDDDYKG
ncbi:hypothetical protein EAF04_004217 [Stromatinia cepivora]|nr:hypothetical protein EAF04_004217 [Stromatinia cepivora]